jgi:hypothetical protein
MTPDEIAAWSARGRRLGCTEALMCLGDNPEVAFPAYRATLAGLGTGRPPSTSTAPARSRSTPDSSRTRTPAS